MRMALSLIRAREGNRPKAAEPTGRQRVLICKWCCLGDAIVSLYAIREFKRRHPDIVIDMLVSSRIAEVYRRAPEIRGVHVLPVTGRRLVLELLNPRLWTRLAGMLRQLRRNRYVQFIDLELYRGTGPILKRLIGIPFSRGFQVEGALPKHHDFEVPLPRTMPEWQCFYRVLGMEIPGNLPEPLYDRKPYPERSGVPGKRIGVVFGSSFNWPQKKWPWERYAELISLLSREGHDFILLGTPDEKEAGGWIAAKAQGKIIDTTGHLDYEGLRKEVASCDLVVGNDTGTMHLAAAYGIPTVTIFGPTDPRKWNPITSNPVFLENIPCRPCYYLGSMPSCDHFSCLRQIEPALVAERVRKGLAAGTGAFGKAEISAKIPPKPAD